jgi:hypothetical protein
MALTVLPGGFYYPSPFHPAAAIPASVSSTLNASGEKYAWAFRVPKSGVLETCEFRIGTVSNNPDNGLRISFQDLDSSGNPDGTQDQYRDIAGPFSSNTWITPGIMSHDGTNGGTKRTVTAGQVLAVVLEFTSFTAGDSINIDVLDHPSAPGGITGFDLIDYLFESAAWSKSLNAGYLALKYETDGYEPVAQDMVPALALSSVTYNTGSASDEYALRFQVPCDMQVDGGWVRADIDNDAELVLYDGDGTTVLGSATFDASQRTLTTAHNHNGNFAPVTLIAGVTYRLSLKPTTGSSIILYGWTANSAGLMAAATGGVEWHRSKRADAGSWTDESTERPWMGIHVSAVPSGTDVSGLNESAEGADTAGYTLTDCFVGIAQESADALDRANYDLVPTFAMTVTEAADAVDRVEYDLLTPLAYTVQESAEGLDTAIGASQVPYGPSMAILTHIYDYFAGSDPWAFSSGHLVNSHDHLGKVLSWGSSTREIPIPAGPPRLGRIELEFDDTPDPVTGVQFFRSQFGARTPKGKRVDLLIGPVGGKESLFQIPAAGTIEHAIFPPGKMRLVILDDRYKWLQKPLPLLINKTNFPNLPVDTQEAFAPFVFGEVNSDDFGGQGAIALVHVDTVQHRYCAACHIVESVAVFRRASDEDEFTEVVSGWSLVYEDFEIGGLTYTFSFVEFDVDQDGAEIRADVSGWPFGGGWGTVPPTIGVQSNVIEHAITFLYFVDALHKGFTRPHDQALSRFDLPSFATVRQQIEDLGYISGYVIAEQMTPEVVLTQLFSTFMIHWFPNRQDKTKVVKTPLDTPSDAPVFGDFHSILLKSEQAELAVDTRNRILYRYGRLYTGSEEWGGQGTHDNLPDQAALTDSDGEPIIEPESVDFHACRDAGTIAFLAAEWAAWRDQDAHRFRFQLHMPTKLTQVDLAKDFLVTHYGGLNAGGWNRERFFPFKVTDLYEPLRFEIEAIRLVSPTLPDNALQSIGDFQWNALVGPWYFAGTRTVYMGFSDNRVSGRGLVILKPGDVPADDGVFPLLANPIGSFQYVRDGNKIHVAAQEFISGRVSYSCFDMAADLWEVVNQTVLTSNSHGDAGVSICIRQPSGRPHIVYQGDRETTDGSLGQFGAGTWKRMKCKTLVDGVWSTEIDIRDTDSERAALWFAIYGDPLYYGSLHINVGRAIAEENNAVRYVFAREEPADVASTQDLQTQILTEDDALSECYEFKFTGGLGYTAQFAYGDPCTFEYDGTFYTAVPVGLLFAQMLCIWESTTLAGPPTFTIPLSTAEIQPDTYGTKSPPMTVRWFNNKLYVVIGTRVTGGEWAALKTISPPFTTAEPAYSGATARDEQVGPTWPNSEYSRHGCEFAKVRGQDILFKVTAGTFGVPNTSGKHIFERINLTTDVPGDNGYTLAEWLTDNT